MTQFPPPNSHPFGATYDVPVTVSRRTRERRLNVERAALEARLPAQLLIVADW
jgi:hypothetical protein